MIPEFKLVRRAWYVLLLTIPCVGSAQMGDSPVLGTALTQAAARPGGAPHASDVCFSSRWRRPLNAEDPHDTFRDAATFHATRLDWVYTTDSSWIRECTRRGYSIGAALNSKLPDTPGVDTRLKGRIRNREGVMVTAPWMQGWDAWWGCVNSPDYRAIFVDHARRCLDGGALYLHVDDPDMNYRAVEWGGCFCPWCWEKAAVMGIDLTDSLAMRAFQRASVQTFYEDFRRRIDVYAGRRVPLSCNNYRAMWDVFPYELFDFGMAELPETDATPATIYERLQASRHRGKAQILTFVSEDIQLTRQVIATTYAMGSHVLVPWDVYLKSTREGSLRYFGQPEDFADLYGFVRACGQLLDEYQETAFVGIGQRSPAASIAFEGGSGTIIAIARSMPGASQSRLVVHLIDWGSDHASTTLRLDRGHLPARRPLSATLFVPPRYSVKTHKEAEATGDYTTLANETALTVVESGHQVHVSLPPLSPWGILVLSPADEQ